jgi:putative oxidoreductase
MRDESEIRMRKLLRTHAPAAVVIIRLMVGAVFISEGSQKFLFPAEVGAGRFEKIGFPRSEIVAPFVGCFEIGCGALVMVGLLTRVAVVPLIVVMVTAIATTKLPILMQQGFWKMAHEARTDWAMLLSCVFLLVVGGGAWSADTLWTRNRTPNQESHGV